MNDIDLSIEERVVDIVAKVCKTRPEEINPGQILRELCMDSVDILEVIMLIEERFHLPQFPEEEIDVIEKVEDFIRLTEEKIEEKDQPAAAA